MFAATQRGEMFRIDIENASEPGSGAGLGAKKLQMLLGAATEALGLSSAEKVQCWVATVQAGTICVL